MRKKAIYIFFLFFLLGIVAHFSLKGYNYHLEIKRKQQELEKQRAAWAILEKEIEKECGGFNGEATIVIKNLNKGWQILINQHELFPSASLVKVPIMAACFYAANDGKIRLEDTLRLKASHVVGGLGPLKNMPVGAEFTVRKLIELMISESDNTATNVLIDYLGFDYLNSSFEKLGLKDTNISRKIMDLRSRDRGIENFTSASDLTYLFEEIYNERLINKAYSQMCLEFLRKQKINDRIPAKLPGYVAAAHKTGLERGICHDAGIVFTPQGNFLICVLVKHPDKTAALPKKFIAQIAFLTYEYYRSL
ncbi:MAG: serine hydrolase [Candidatus Omnitrophota bacterium]